MTFYLPHQHPTMDRLVKQAENGDIDGLELSWMEAAEDEDTDWADMLIAARTIAKKHDAGVAESLLRYLVSTLEGEGRPYEALSVVEQACRFLPQSDRLRREYTELYHLVHGHQSWCEQALGATLKNAEFQFPEALELLKKIEQLPPGTYVRKDPGAKIGKIERIIAGEGIEVNVEGRAQLVPLSRLEELHPLDANDIRALVLFERERLVRLADEQPAELLRLVLNSFEGRTELKRIRRYLQAIVGESRWNAWWSTTRKETGKAPDIGSTAGKNPQFFIRAKHVSRGEELKNEFDRAADPDRPQLAHRIGGDIDEKREDDRQLAACIADELIRISCENAEQSPALAADALAVLWRLGSMFGTMSDDLKKRPGWVESSDWVHMLRYDLTDSPYLIDILEFLPAWLPDSWSEVLMGALPYLPRNGCRRAVNSLGSEQSGTMQRRKAVDTILSHPDARLGALLWIWSLYRTAPEQQGQALHVNGPALLRRILAAAASEGRARSGRSKSSARDLDSLKDAFTGEGEEAVEAAAGGVGDREIPALINLIERNPGLNEDTRKRMVRAVRAANPALFRVSTPPWESHFIYTTRGGLERRQRMYAELVNVKIPAIIKQVGEAAEFGDLSENAEYTAALEERERLSRAAQEVRKELSLARIIAPEMAGTRHVNIGSRVKGRDCHTGRIQELTFLGPWDADPASGIYAYNSPLALAFMGAETGDKVGYDSEEGPRRWEVLAVEPAVEFLG